MPIEIVREEDLQAINGHSRGLGLVPKTDGPWLLAQLNTDTGNAERFVLMHKKDVRYCHALRAWFIFDGRVWVRDERDQVRHLAKKVMVEFLRQATNDKDTATEKFARSSLDSKRLGNMLKEAQCDLSISPSEMDQDPDLLVFQNCTVKLNDASTDVHRPEQLITKMVQFNYNPEAQCPLFLATLFRLMGGDPDANDAPNERARVLVETLQRCFGYALTGRTSEKVVFILFGSGNNGKTTILSLFLRFLGPYAVLLQIDSLMNRKESNNSQADLADLRGARFVMTSETEEGQRLAEGRLKRITQGMGRIKAVRKFENPIEFAETHKLFMDANYRPDIRGMDPAIWNRLFIIPFTVTIPKEQIDRELQTKLMAEAEGILAWAVAGAAEWYRNGLQRPREVEDAVQNYRSEMDQVGRFIEERCVMGQNVSSSARTLYAAYKAWAEEVHEFVITASMFGRKLQERQGVMKKESNGTTLYLGVGIKEMDRR